jgi:hypothetical protein
MPILPEKLPETVEEHVQFGNILKELLLDSKKLGKISKPESAPDLASLFDLEPKELRVFYDLEREITEVATYLLSSFNGKYSDTEARQYYRVPLKEGWKVPIGPVNSKEVYFCIGKYKYKLEKNPLEEVTAW